jgi:hypothetical protein
VQACLVKTYVHLSNGKTDKINWLSDNKENKELHIFTRRRVKCSKECSYLYWDETRKEIDVLNDDRTEVRKILKNIGSCRGEILIVCHK